LASTFDLILSRIPPRTIGKMEHEIGKSKINRKLRLAANAGRIPEREFLEAVADYTGLTIAELVDSTLAEAGFDLTVDDEVQQLTRRIAALSPTRRHQVAEYLDFLESRD
jgi:hypothetical protein